MIHFFPNGELLGPCWPSEFGEKPSSQLQMAAEELRACEEAARSGRQALALALTDMNIWILCSATLPFRGASCSLMNHSLTEKISGPISFPDDARDAPGEPMLAACLEDSEAAWAIFRAMSDCSRRLGAA